MRASTRPCLALHSGWNRGVHPSPSSTRGRGGRQGLQVSSEGDDPGAWGGHVTPTTGPLVAQVALQVPVPLGPLAAHMALRVPVPCLVVGAILASAMVAVVAVARGALTALLPRSRLHLLLRPAHALASMLATATAAHTFHSRLPLLHLVATARATAAACTAALRAGLGLCGQAGSCGRQVVLGMDGRVGVSAIVTTVVRGRRARGG